MVGEAMRRLKNVNCDIAIPKTMYATPRILLERIYVRYSGHSGALLNSMHMPRTSAVTHPASIMSW